MYEFTARDEGGHEVRGQVDAANVEAARQVLSARGWEIESLQPAADTAGPGQPPVHLSPHESGEVVAQLAQVSAAHLPLAPALRAAAEQWGPGRVAQGLDWLAGQLEQGRSMDEVLGQSTGLLAPHVARLIQVSASSGGAGESLLALTEHHQAMDAFRRQLWRGFAYPLTVLALAVIVLGFILIYVSGAVQQMTNSFGLELPLATRVLFWFHDVGIWVVGGGLLAGLGLIVIVRLLLGPATWQRLLAAIPVVGPLVTWAGVADWSGLMSVLLSQQLALPEALRLAGHGVYDAETARISDTLADGVARGRKLSDLMALQPGVPASLLPLIRWGESQDTLAEALKVGQSMLQQQAQSRALLLQAILPPLLFVIIGCGVLFVVAGEFAPLIDLISHLS